VVCPPFSRFPPFSWVLGKWGQTTFRKHSENVVCPRYLSDVITQFRDRYPKIQLNVFTVEN